MFYKDNECSYQSKYCCFPPINVNVTCESSGGNGDGDGCCCSKVSMREAINFLISSPISQYLSNTPFNIFGIKQITTSGVEIILASNDLVAVGPTLDNIASYISLCSIYNIVFTAASGAAANNLETAIRNNPLYNGPVTIPDDPCCCKGEIINELVERRNASANITLDMERVSSSNISGEVIGVAPDIAFLRDNTGQGTTFHLVSICRIASFIP